MRLRPLRSAPGALVSFLFHRCENLEEPAQLFSSHPTRDGLFQIGEVTVNPAGNLTPLECGRDDERPAIRSADLPRDESTVGKPIQDARQRRPLVREATMQILDGRWRGLREVRKDVRLALRQAKITQVGQVQPDPVGRPVNVWNQPQGHQQ
jgi:hypothetical protein